MNKNSILKPKASKNGLEFFNDKNLTIGLNSKDKDSFGREITFEEAFYELAKRDLIVADMSLRTKLLSFSEARMDNLGNMYLFN